MEPVETTTFFSETRILVNKAQSNAIQKNNKNKKTKRKESLVELKNI